MLDRTLLDASIDIAPASVSNILNRLSRQVYITQEVTDTTGVYVSKHQDAGDVQVYVNFFTFLDLLFSTARVFESGGMVVDDHVYEWVFRFNYAFGLKDAFLNSGISSLCNVNNRGWLSGNLANVFVTNHDTEREGTSLNYTSGNV